MKTTRVRFFGAAAAALTIAGTLAAPVAASASEEGRRNTTLALGALTGYLFTRGGSKVPAFLGAAGTAYAYKQYDDSIRNRHRREEARRAYYRNSRSSERNRSRYSDSRRDYYRSRRDDRYDRDRDRDRRYSRSSGRHDNGLHLGWYKGKHKGDKHHR